MNSGAPEGYVVPSPHVAPVMLQIGWQVMNEERHGLWLWKM